MSHPRVRELSPRGAGGVSVIEVSGPGAVARVLELAPSAALPPQGTPALVRLQARGEALDEALLLVHAPERVELHVHGSPPLVARLLAELGGVGAPAPADLEEQALELLPAAPCEAAARILLDQSRGALRRELEDALAAPEAGPALEALVERGRIARRALEPATVVLAGPVNAGKSTLFNLLVGARRVVVSPLEGTTRDVVVERAMLGAWPVDLCDSAGLRALEPDAPDARVEAAGQELARDLLGRADLVVWLDPADRPLSTPPRTAGALVRLRSRADLAPAAPGEEEGIGALRDGAAAARRVAELFRRALGLPEEPWIPGRGCPFTPAQRETLEGALRARGEARRRALERLLARAR